jgi:hypothetical protein
MCSIILATIFIKQHSVFDVITAFVMAIVLYPLAYGKTPEPLSSSTEIHSAKSGSAY